MTNRPAPSDSRAGRRATAGLAAIAVGVVLADSSVVTLGLPDILREFDAGVTDVAWVLVSFNVVLALLARPAASLVRRHGAGGAWRLGIAVFACASLACAIAAGHLAATTLVRSLMTEPPSLLDHPRQAGAA